MFVADCSELTLQKFAGVYKKVVFLHFYAESNEMTKYLDQVKLKVERHPHFAFFRNGKPWWPVLELTLFAKSCCHPPPSCMHADIYCDCI